MRTHTDGAAPDEISVGVLWGIVVRHRRLVIGLALGAALIAGLVTAVRSRSYTATATFMPQSTSSLGSLAGMASQFGFSLPTENAGESPAFYAELLESRSLLSEAVNARYQFVAADQSWAGTLIDLFEVDGDDLAERREAASEALRDKVRITTDGTTGTVKVDVTTRWAGLSHAILGRLLGLLQEFNLERRQSQASAERKFVEGRVAEARDSLRTAEERMERFLQRNREFQASPQLALAYDRLQREVLMRQQLYTTLAQSYEQARMNEVRNTPVITVLDEPSLPTRPDPRWLLLKVLVSGIAGGMAGLVIALARSNAELVPPAAEMRPLRPPESVGSGLD